MAVIGQLEIELLANVARIQKDMDSVKRSVGGAMDSIDKAVGLAKAALGGLGIGLSALSFISSAKDALNFADRMNDVAKANDVAVGSILKLSQALSLNGGEADSASKIFSAFTSSIDDAASGTEKTQAQFKKLGISLKDIATLDGQALFEKTLSGLQAIEDPIKRNATAMDLLGKAAKGVDIQGLGQDFADNDSDFTNAEKSFKEIGIAMDKLDILTTKASRSLAELFAPALTTSVELLERFVFGYSQLEKNITAANKAANDKKGISDFKAAPTLKDKPALGMFNLPAEYQAIANLRDVKDTAAIDAAKKLEEEKAKARAAAKASDEERLKKIKLAFDTEKYYTDKTSEIYNKSAKYQVEDEKKAYETKIKNINLIQKAQDDRFQEQIKQQEELQKKEEEAAKELNRSITDALLRGFESGKSFAKNFIDTLKNLFQTLVLRPVISFLVDASGITKVLSGVGALVSGTASASSGQQSASTNSFLGSVKDIFSSGNNSIISSIESLGANISNGLGGVQDAIGGFIGENASAISDGFGYFGSVLALSQGKIATSIGSAIGTFYGGPIGAAIGGAIGGIVDSLIGGKGHAETKAYANQTLSSDGTSLLNSRVTKGKGGGAGGYDNGITGAAGISNAILGITKALGGTIENSFKLGFVYLSKYDSFGININRDITRRNYDLSFKTGDSQAGAAYTFFQLVNKNFIELEPVLKSVINRSQITYANALSAITALGQIQQINSALKDLPPIFKSIGDAIKNNVTVDTVAALVAQFNAINTYTALFYTDAEKVTTFTAQLNTAFGKLNVSLPDSRDGFRNLVDGLDTTTASGLATFNSLIGLAPTLDTYYKALQAQKDAAQQAADSVNALTKAYSDDKFKSLVDFTRYQRVSDNYGTSFANNYVDNLPSYDVGTSYVPKDGPAMLHQGEAVLTRQENSSRGSGSGETADLLRQLISELRAGNVPLIQAAQKSAKILDKFDANGVVLSEFGNDGNRTVINVRTVA